MNASLFAGKAGGVDHQALVDEIAKDTQRSQTRFIEYYREHYNTPHLPPSWAMAECMSFGFWSKTYKIIANHSTRDRIAKMYGVNQSSVFGSWLRASSYLRNHTYHHGRLLGAYLVITIASYRHIRLSASVNQTFYAYATVIHYLLTHTGTPTTWKADLEDLFARFPGIDPCELGFAPGWASSPGWGP
jgi:abortive infection bacteriophage resistance protein